MREDIKSRIKEVRNGEVPAEYKKVHPYVVPKDWSVRKLGSITKRTSRPNKDGRERPAYSINNRKGFVPQSEQFEEGSYQDLDKSAYKIVRKGEFAYNPARVNVGSIGRLRDKDEVIVSSLYVCVSVDDKVDGEFFDAWTKTRDFYKETVRNTEGSVREYLFYENFANMRIPLPPLAEQQKIAEILATCDRVIALKQQLLEEKRRQKQWLMQKLLDPNSGVRLPGCEGSEWYTVTLDDYCDCLDTLRKPVNAQQREKMQGSYPYWGANSIQGYVNDYLFDEEIVLMAEDGGCFDDLKTKPLAVYVNEKCWVNNHAHILRAKNGNTKLLYFVLVHKDIRNYINGTTRSKLTQGDMMSISITLPKNPQEQKRLIDVLTACETEIELFEQELDVWQQKKKALMQFLLTGLVRVNA